MRSPWYTLPMRLSKRFGLGFALLIFAASSAFALPRPDTPDQGVPFLPVGVPDITRLIQTVKNDPSARRHYAQVFHVKPSQVPLYFQKNFVPETLTHTNLYTVSLVSHRGTIYPVWMTLRAGTPIFASRRTALMLLRTNGDPVTPLVLTDEPTDTEPPGEQIIIPTETQIVLPTTPTPSP
jgi:hypothetical protein